MGSWRWVFGLVLAIPGVAWSAEPEASFTTTTSGESPQGWTAPPELPVPPAPSSADGQDPMIDAEFLLGLPVAVRVEALLDRGERVSYALEAVAGVYIIVPFAGLGGRMLWSAIRGQEDAFQINPGLEVDVVPQIHNFIDRSVALITPDVEFLWLHDLKKGYQSEVGIDLGGGVPLEYSNHFFVPRLSVCLGVRF